MRIRRLASRHRLPLAGLAASLTCVILSGGLTQGQVTPRGAGPAVPVIRIEVIQPEKAELQTLPPLIEGRLLARLRERTDFRLVPHDEVGDTTMTIDVRSLVFTASGSFERPYDAESDPNRPQYAESLGAELYLDLALTRQGSTEPFYEDSLSFMASRKLDPDLDRLRNLLTDELLDKLADRVPKLVKKRLKR